MDTDLEIQLYKIDSRLDALEEQVKELLIYYRAYDRIEKRAIQHQRIVAATKGGELITRRDIQRIKGVNAGAVEQWCSDPTFPAPVELGVGSRPARYAKASFDLWYEQHLLKPKVRAAVLRKQAEEELKAKGQE